MDAHKPEFSVIPAPPQPVIGRNPPEIMMPRHCKPYIGPLPTSNELKTRLVRSYIPRVVPLALLEEFRARFPGRTFVVPEDLSEQERDELQFRDGGYLRGKMPRAPYIDLEDGGFYDGNLRRIRKPRFKNKD